ncbi:MAG TPA: TetR/AcrR family transcriptional regulator [Thermoleophilaceae bacterium]|jgi:AcrR family transcriptional regulator
MTTRTPGEAEGGRREERKAQNRAKLLLAARKVFAEKGYGEATARDIVRETDLATGTFYNYFEDKQDAFMALLDEMSEKGRALARAQRQDPASSLEERIAGAYRAYFEWAVQENDLFDVFRRNASVIALLPDREPFELGISELLEDLTAWAEAGDIPRGDFEYLAVAGVGMGFQIATHLVEGDPPDVEGATRFCTRMFMGGLRALGED